MPRKPRKVSSTGVYHFITRGINKRRVFHRERDFKFFLTLLREYAEKLGVSIYHYCILSNHGHLVLKTDSLNTLSKWSHLIHRRYAYYYCKTYLHSGQVFRRNFLSNPINDDIYLLECGRYVERNPIEAELVKKIEDYRYSSYPYYAFGKRDPMITRSPLYPNLGRNNLERRIAYRFYIGHKRRPDPNN